MATCDVAVQALELVTDDSSATNSTSVLLTGDVAGRVMFYDAAQLTKLFEVSMGAPVYSLCVSPRFDMVVAGCAKGRVVVHALPGMAREPHNPDASLIGTFRTRTAKVSAAAFAQVEGAKGLATAAKDMASEAAGEASKALRGLWGWMRRR